LRTIKPFEDGKPIGRFDACREGKELHTNVKVILHLRRFVLMSDTEFKS